MLDYPLVSPTVVEYAVSAVLAPGEQPSLILTRGTLLEIYTIAGTRPPQSGAVRAVSRAGPGGAALRLRLREPLAGRAVGLAVWRRPGSRADALLLGVEPAKLSLLELDEVSGTLRTRASFSFDALAAELGPRDAPLPVRLRCDPTGEVGLMLAFSTLLLAVPLDATCVGKPVPICGTPHISAHLRTSPHISARLPTPPRTSRPSRTHSPTQLHAAVLAAPARSPSPTLRRRHRRRHR